jgi:hypothetical protein
VSLVLDASATLGWICLDEVTALTERIFQRVADSGAWVPSIWPIEIANSLQMGVRRLPLASLDAPLCAAARELGVPVVGE